VPREYQGRRVVILGLARQGIALARYLAQSGARVVVSDRQPAEKLAAQVAALSDLPIEFALGGHPESLLDSADLLCLSGGVAADLPLAQAALRRGVRLSNDSQIFLEACPPGVLVIGITGSAGKTTTTTLVGRMCEAQMGGAHLRSRGWVRATREAAGEQASGAEVWVGGNIGHPLIADLARMRAGDIVVMELSSFQLELMTRSPQVAAVLNLTPNHLDRHGSLAAYAAAKSRSLLFQDPDGVAVLGRDDPGALALAPLARGRLAFFSAEGPVDDGAYLQDDRLRVARGGRTEEAASLGDIELRGRHNVLNVLAACAISAAAGAAPAAMRAGLVGFTGLEHRLELVGERRGARWYNDSIATAPERVIAALRSFDEPIVLLLGGRDKQLPWDELAQLVRTRVKAAVLFGEAGPLIEAALEKAGVPPESRSRWPSLAQAMPAAAALAAPGDVVLLSPGGTGYDEFRDFVERGEKFREWLGEMGNDL
jgi:UDP-N-acetylmuramoylalanine--D-glutamate ligase